jgi:hypothetical protein
LRWDLHRVDDSNIGDHHWLTAGDECFYFHEYTPKQGFNYSPANDFVLNFKIKVRHRNEPRYHYKTQAINEAGRRWSTLLRTMASDQQLTLVPIPPSKARDHAEYDDRVWRAIRIASTGRQVDARELIVQTESYAAAHEQGDGHRIRPEELQPMYRVSDMAPRQRVILFDDMLTTGCHFVAARNAILEKWPDRQVLGFFLARRVPVALDLSDLLD